MKQNIAALIDAINNDQIASQTSEVTLAALKKNIAKTMLPLYEFVKQHLAKEELAVAELKVKKTDLVFRVETNVVNLPLGEPARIEKFMSDEETAGVNVYLVAVGEQLNPSGLRIDEMTNAEEFTDHLTDHLTAMNDWVQGQLDAFEGNESAIDEK